MSPYLVLKLVHVALAIVAIGGTLTYALWLSLAERQPEHLVFTIRGIRAIDRRIANPAYVLLLVTGVAVLLVGGIPLPSRGGELAALGAEAGLIAARLTAAVPRRPAAPRR